MIPPVQPRSGAPKTVMPLPNGRYLHCPEGGHLPTYDDQETYFSGLVDFLGDLPS